MLCLYISGGVRPAVFTTNGISLVYAKHTNVSLLKLAPSINFPPQCNIFLCLLDSIVSIFILVVFFVALVLPYTIPFAGDHPAVHVKFLRFSD